MAKHKQSVAPGGTPRTIPVDLYRSFVFPNRVRELRRARGHAKLLPLSHRIPEIPYIRLSKIERGEVVARADELRRIAGALGVAPSDLLIDVGREDFDIATWSEPFRDGAAPDLAAEEFAVLLGAALRAHRTADPALTIAALDRDYGLPAVNLSRIENAQKTFERWNAATRKALFAIFGVADEASLRDIVGAMHRAGALDAILPEIANPDARLARSAARIDALSRELAGDGGTGALVPPADTVAAASRGPQLAGGAVVRTVSLRGAPLPGGLIADTDTGESAEAPSNAGPRAFALRVCRATLGGGLPAQAIVIVDPDRLPAPGGLVALREADGWRLLSVGAARDGSRIGYSANPALEIALDDVDPATLATVVSATFP